MKLSKKVTIIIPSWNGINLLKKNLPHVIAAKNNKKNNIAEIIIVDDKSEDNTLTMLKKNFSSNIKIISHKINRGFPSAVNTGVRAANTELVCLLNNDVVPTINFLEKTNPLFRKFKNLFAVSLHEKGQGPSLANLEEGFIGHKRGIESDKIQKSFWASGGSAVFKRSIWNSLKGFDEKLYSPFYFEDKDICYRALKRGYLILWDPNALVYHNHESTINSTNFRKYYISLVKERNDLLFNWKNITSKRLITKHRSALVKRISRHPGYLKVFFYALLKTRKLLKLRKVELQETKISDEAIIESFKNA